MLLEQLGSAQGDLDKTAGHYNLPALRDRAKSLEEAGLRGGDSRGVDVSLSRVYGQIEAGEKAAKAAADNKIKVEQLKDAVEKQKAAVEAASSAAAESIKAFHENKDALEKLTEKITTESALLDIRKSTNKTVGEIGAPATLGGSSLLAERGNAALIAGGHADQVSGDSQEIISNLGALMAGHSVTLKQAAQMILRADATKDSLQAAVAAMDRTSEKMITYCKASADRLGKIEDKLAELTAQMRDAHNK